MNESLKDNRKSYLAWKTPIFNIHNILYNNKFYFYQVTPELVFNSISYSMLQDIFNAVVLQKLLSKYE